MSAVRLASTTDLSREEWLQVRSQGIGGSDIAAIVGASPWDTPLSIYLRKVGELPEKEETEAMYWGTVLEEVVAQEYKRRHPEVQVRRVNAVLQHPETPYFLANIDREIRIKGRRPLLLEIKTTSAWNGGRWNDKVPDHVMAQVQWYMGICGYHTAVVAVLIGGQEYREYEVARDDELIEYLQILAKRFWENHVIPRIPPAPEAPSDAGFFDLLYPESKGSDIDLTVLGQDVLHEYDDARKAEEEAKKRRLVAEAKLKRLLGEHELGYVGERRITWKNVVQSRFDSQALKQDHPDIYERYLRTSSYRRFQVR